MQQLTCVSPGELVWWDVESPFLKGGQDALVRPLAVARCDIDIPLACGLFPADRPFAVGHECIGEVVAVGDGVRSVSPGDRVAVAFQVSCGACSRCAIGHTAVCQQMPLLSDYGMQPLSGVEYGGMLSELVRVPFADAMLTPVGQADPLALASVSDNVADGYRAVAPHLRERPGSSVLVVYHSVIQSIPLYAVQAALALGAGEVVFASDDREALALAGALGAEVRETDFAKPDGQFPIVVDAGVTDLGLRYAIASTEPEGVCQSVSMHATPDVSFPMRSMYMSGVRFQIGRTHSAHLLPEIVPLIQSGVLSPERVTTRVVDLAEAPQAWLEPAIKLIVKMT